MRVLVLGCGPAGLIAANAAYRAGAHVAILSKPRKSLMNGAQYLHKPVMGVKQEAFRVEYRMAGEPEAYRFKVYGRSWDGTVSPEDLEDSHDGYDIRDAYDRLWFDFKGAIQPWDASPGGLRVAIAKNRADLVVSTIPAPMLCIEGHQFRSSKIYSTDKIIGSGAPTGDNWVVCNGLENPLWYRASRIQGFENTEWPADVKPPIAPMWEVIKPLKTNCDCFPDVIRGGRYGKWTKGVLSHEIQDEVFSACRTFLERQ